MDKEFYNLAVKLMDNIRQLEPNLVSAHDSELCVLMTDTDQIYAGIAGVKISAGQLMRACPEYNAIMAAISEGESRVKKLITVSFGRREVSQPCEGCLALLGRVNRLNRDTAIYIATNRAVPASDLLPDLAVEETVPEPEVVFAEEPETVVVPEAEAPAAPDAVEETAQQPNEPVNEFVESVNEFAESMNEFAEPVNEFAEQTPEELLEEVKAMIPSDTPKAAAPAAEPQKPEEVNEFAQFGFEEAERTDEFVDKIVPDADNPFYEAPSMDAGAPKFMRAPGQDAPQYQSGYLDNPMAQSGYQQSGYLNGQQGGMYASQPLPGQQPSNQMGSMYASQALPGQGQRPGVFQPGAQPFQPGAQPFQPGQPQFQQAQPYQQPQYGSQPYQQAQPYQQPQYGSQPYQQAQPYQQPQYGSQPYQPNPQYQSQQFSNQMGGGQYASQPLPGSGFGNQNSGVNQPQSQAQPQTPDAKDSGSAFRDQLNAFVSSDSTQAAPKNNGSGISPNGIPPQKNTVEKPLSRAEMLRQAKEKKKMAKIDAEFKKQMRKKGF